MLPGFRLHVIAAGLWLSGLGGLADAQGIYTCVDARGRRLTADRPIAECIDREQHELNASGTIKRRIAPSQTAQERAAQEAKAREELERQSRIAEEKKRERALVTRYPDQRAHDKERLAAVRLVDDAIAAARKSTDELAAARKRLDAELEFHGSDASKAPARLKRQIEENTEHMQAQQRFVANQESERKRINAQFDEELVKLKQLWAQGEAPVAVPTKTSR